MTGHQPSMIPPTAIGIAVPTVTDPDDYSRLREVLAAANYTDEGVVKALGVDTLVHLRDRKLPVLLRRTSGGTPRETLIRLFILGRPVDIAAARAAFAPMTLEKWAEIGLVEVAGSSVHALVQLRCYQGMVLAFDFPHRGSGGLRPDHVMGVSPSSLVLAAMTVRKPIASTLDLGCGCGIQAFLAAGHSQRATAVDCNPRAVAITRFNTHVNRLDRRVECIQGDMFQPVAGRTFDLIVSNPPFIIAPEHRHMFLSSELGGDEICRRLAREAPAFLNQGGHCIFNANWEVVEGEDWRQRLAGWFTGTGCDVLVLHQDNKDLLEYAASFIEAGEPQEYFSIFDEWMSYYATRHITAVGHGVIIMHRTGEHSNWFAIEDAPAAHTVACGDDVTLLLQQRGFLKSLRDDQQLLDTRFKLPPYVRLEQISETAGGTWRPVACQLRRMAGLQYSGEIDVAGAAMLARCDGQRPLREHLSELAGALNTDVSAIAPMALGIIRRLIEKGFLVPAEG